MQFLVASVQAIDKPDTGVVYQEAEQPQLWGDPPAAWRRSPPPTPVVIVDEPQNFTTDLRKRAIATLNPLVALRYSATHAEQFNLVHRLGPKAATELGLVKRVSVKGVVAGDSGKPYLRVNKLRTKSKRLFAEVMIDVDVPTARSAPASCCRTATTFTTCPGGSTSTGAWWSTGSSAKPDRVVFEDGTERPGRRGDRRRPHGDLGGPDPPHDPCTSRRQHQIDATGRRRQGAVPVLRRARGGLLARRAAGPVCRMFDALYREEWVRAGGAPTARTRRHCASTTSRRPRPASTRTPRASPDAQEQQARAYEEIIAQQGTDPHQGQPAAFIFSHSALKEGWDNPNVFQVGFLRHSGSELERRQQIGRGLRLPVDETGTGHRPGDLSAHACCR